MIKEQLELITLYKGKAPQKALSPLDIMMFAEADHNAPILDSQGNVRSYYIYLPESGLVPCTSGIYLIREDSSLDSAIEILEKTGWAERAERDHYAIILPNPTPDGWNVAGAADKADDYSFIHTVLNEGSTDFLIKGKVHRTSKYMAGFGIGATMAAGVCMQHGEMIAGLFADEPKYPAVKPAGTAPVPAWFVNPEAAVSEYFKNLNIREEFPFQVFSRGSLALYQTAWDEVFHGLRRWPVRGTGVSAHKSTVEEMGLKEYHQISLGDNDGLPHDWYEFAPRIHERFPEKKLPLLFVLHGGGTSAKYVAEQNRWHELAEKFGFFVVYPQSCVYSVWNAGCDVRLPSDEEYLLNLFEHITHKYPVDMSRVYCTGFSMGSLMTQCMGMLHFDLFAAIAPFSGYLFDEYWKGPEITETQPYALTQHRAEKLQSLSGQSMLLPLIQFYGTSDQTWNGDAGVTTRKFWSDCNAVPEIDLTESPDCVWGVDERFSIYDSCDREGNRLYRFVSVKDLPHSVDLRQPYLAWEFMSKFSRDDQTGEIKINAS